MAIALLTIQQRGSGQFSSVSRLAAATPEQVGNNFTAMTLTSVTGTTTVGHTVKGATSHAAGLVTQILSAGSTTVLFLNTITGTFQAETVADTLAGAAGSNLSGTLGSPATPSPATVGILEFAGTATYQVPQDRVLSFSGTLYACINNYILQYDGSANWSVVYTCSPALTQAQSNCHTGLHVLYPNGTPLLGFVWGSTTLGAYYSATSPDGVTWTTTTLSGGTTSFILASSGVQREVAWNNSLYWMCFTSGGQPMMTTWNPLTGSIAFIAQSGSLAATNYVQGYDLYVYQNKLIVFAQINGNNTAAGLFLYQAGTFTTLVTFAAPTGVNVASNSGNQWTLWDDQSGSGSIYCAFVGQSSGNYGWLVEEVTVSGGVYTDAGNVGPTVLAGTGIPLYNSGSSTNPMDGRWSVVIDNVTDPGSPAVYLNYAAADTAGTAVLPLLWNGPSASVTVILGSGSNVQFALPHTRAGGGERIWGPGEPDCLATMFVDSGSNVTISLTVEGGGTRTVAFYWSQTGEVPLNEATLSGPSQGTLSGKTITGVPANGSTTTVTWVAGPSGDNIVNLATVELQPTVLA